MSTAAEQVSSESSVIFCEGYADRAFLAELLVRLGCVVDRSLKPPVRGAFGFRSGSTASVHLVPLGGLPGYYDELALFLKAQRPLAKRFLAIVDHDGLPGKPGSDRRKELAGVLSRKCGAANAGESLRFDDGTTLDIATWEVQDNTLPGRQILEKLIASGIACVYPARVRAVAEFLQSRPEPPTPETGKETAFTYAAAWDGFGDEFYREVWRDPRVAAELERRIELSGLMAHLRAMTSR